MNEQLLKMMGSMLGIKPEELGKMATDVMGVLHSAGQALQRIEKNQHTIIEAENERRKSDGRNDFLTVATSNSDGGNPASGSPG